MPIQYANPVRDRWDGAVSAILYRAIRHAGTGRKLAAHLRVTANTLSRWLTHPGRVPGWALLEMQELCEGQSTGV